MEDNILFMVIASVLTLMNLLFFMRLEKLYQSLRVDKENQKLNEMLQGLLEKETGMNKSAIESVGRLFTKGK